MAFLEFRPYSAFNFGGRNRKPKAENFPFRPKVSASGIPLVIKGFPFYGVTLTYADSAHC